MLLNDDIELIAGLPIAHIKSVGAIACADLHLGYEGVMAKKGILIPKVNLKYILEALNHALKKTGAGTVIINGDIKNEFSTVDIEEFNELYELINFAKEKSVELTLIKGNHDNFVERYREPFNLKVYHQEAKIGTYLFFHGEELPSTVNDADVLVMGHEHPAVVIYDSIGKKVKLNCFLYGHYKRKRLLIMPALNYFASGTGVNIEPQENLLAPIFKEIDVDNMKAIVIGYGETMGFGEVGELRRVASQA